MEGYTNVIGSQYDFDDLDIEGRVVDEWNAEDEENNATKIKGLKPLDEGAILSERVRLDNGQQADVFTVIKKQNNVWYTCHVCADTVVGLPLLRQHVETKKHKTNMSRPVHPRAKFVKLDPNETLALEPGEPVPPGLEEVIIENCLIQPKLDAYTSSPLIGLEFLVELTQSSLYEGTYYYCLLCDKTGSERNIFIHLTSVFHYLKYLRIYFPTLARKLSTLPNQNLKKSFGLLVIEILQDIEAKYGRMKPHSETHSNFHAPGRKAELQKAIRDGPHVRETDDETFVEKATAENVDKKTKELLSTMQTTTKMEDVDKVEDNKQSLGISVFNKTNRISVDKKQIRPREDALLRSSPDVQIVDIQLPKSPDKKKRSRSKSLSTISTISSSSSGKGRYHGRSRHRSSLPRAYHNWSRSRSRSPSYRHRRRRSPSYSRRHSPGRKWNRGHRDSRERSSDSHKYKGTDRYGRSRDNYDGRSEKHRRDKNDDRGSPKEITNIQEKIRWGKFRKDLKKIETVKLEKLKFYEKNPEKHPQYPEEWKSFWNRRYNELQRSGVDPAKHDFKPEWISFWTKRMKELYEEDLGKAKDELKNKFDLPEDNQSERVTPWKPRKRNNTSPGLIDISPPTPDKKDVIADIKTTWKAFTGSDIKDAPKRPLSPWEEESKTRDLSPPTKRDSRRYSPKSRSQSPMMDKLLEDMPQRRSRTSPVIFVLRKLTVLEQQVGSLAPKVFEMLSQSLALEKIKEDASLDLLCDSENCVFLETIREKLIALLCAGVVPRNLVNTARSAIKHTDIALHITSKRQRCLPVAALRSAIGLPPTNPNILHNQYTVQPKSEPVVVPGVGQVDKIAIAQQIATALIEQGKTNVTEAELEQLINAVVGMAEASVNSTHPMTTANFLHQLQSMQNMSYPNIPAAVHPSAEPPAQMYKQAPQVPYDMSSNRVVDPNPQQQTTCGALKLLQSAYNDTVKTEQDSPKRVPVASNSTPISDTDLAATLALFNKTSKEEQPGFIQRLQATNPEMHRRLGPFIPSNVLAQSERTKRSPITIPISKEKSTQKIKSLDTGRLSPFSSRSGGANPTVSDAVTVDDEDDDKVEVVTIIAETPPKPQVSHSNQEKPKYKFGNSDVDDDDDDDDYSFEDVYKAAQEKLRQNQLKEETKNNQPIVNKDINTKDTSRNEKIKEPEQVSCDQSHKNVSTNNTSWNSNDEEKKMFTASDSFCQQKELKENNFKKQYIAHQQSFPSDGDKFKETPVPANQPKPYETMDTSTLAYQEREQQPTNPYTDSSFDGGTFNNFPVTDQYSNESFYSKTDPQFYDHYSGNQPHPSGMEPYSNPQRDAYDVSYRDPYNTMVNPAYGGHVAPYADQYQYRDNTVRGDSQPCHTEFPNPPPPPHRYSNSGYPPY